jgi:Na+/proline symporter/signal transduction histidine kinase
MTYGWAVVATGLVYIGLLFAIAYWADQNAATRLVRGRPLIYALTLGVYCTSWTFYGSVGLVTVRGFDFLTIYIGPILMFAVATPLVIRVVRIAKQQNITSVADFIASRHGKNQRVAALVTTICAVGAVPYVALQLKAVSSSISTVLGGEQAPAYVSAPPIFGDMALLVALSLVLFSVMFGTRHIDATEHQHGLMFAIAVESAVKLFAFLAVGAYVTFGLFDGPYDLFTKAADVAGALAPVLRPPDGQSWLTMIFLSFTAALLLPRMFHVTVVENTSERDLRRAAWMFPLYLIAINIFVLPIAIAGVVTFAPGSVDADMFVLTLPLAGGSTLMSLLAFIGGLSAATAMVIVATVALSIMIGNEIIMPLLLKRRPDLSAGADMGRIVLRVRRLAILAIIMLAYAYYKLAASNQALAQIGLLSFAATAQLAPAFFGGLVWRQATARGAIAGLTAGFGVWFYTLLLPSFATAGIVPADFLLNGPFGISALRPHALFGISFEPLTHGVFWSVLANVVCYVAFSIAKAPEAIEKVQAKVFIEESSAQGGPSFKLWRTSVTVQDLQDTVSRYLGVERTEASFQAFARSRGVAFKPGAEADIQLLRHSEHLLASAIGAASSRLVLSLLLRRRNVSTKTALKLLDDASAAIQYNRDLLQTALDEVGQGIAVVDRELRLITWNRRFQALLDLAPDSLNIGTPIDEIFRALAQRGEFGRGEVEALVQSRLEAFLVTGQVHRGRLAKTGITLEIRTAPMPDGGFVTTFSDVTEQVRAAEELERANETLEARVRERTEELVRLNQELARAKAEADEANLGKTKFLAAAGHDILQPLNAARLYATSLVERDAGAEEKRLAENVGQSLDAVEEIIGTLLDISRLDAGALKPELSTFRLGDLLRQLEVEFTPIAKEKGLKFTVVGTSLAVRSDRRLLRRLLQNLVSNAVKYTPKGRVLIGCRRRSGQVIVQVWDTGLGIPQNKQKLVFREFQRLDQGARAARGLGLGLSIVERIARVLGHRIALESTSGRGSMFSVELPLVARVLAPRSEESEAPRVSSFLSGTTVLCLDNEEAILDGMSLLLSGWGCSVLPARSASEALEFVQSAGTTPDVILADYHLDEGTGLDAIERLRAEIGANVPALLITADRTPQVREAARVRQIGLLNKPLKPAALRAVISQWRAQRSAAE